MSWQKYQNELIVLGTFLVMLGTYIYKYNQIGAETNASSPTQQKIDEIKEVVALQKVWDDKSLSKKVKNLETLISTSKVKWSKKNKEVNASYKALSSQELNNLTTKILNLPVEILLLDIKKIGSTYTMEFKCKW